MLQPAERCCGTCSLLQGVQIISSYTVVVGLFDLLSLLMRGMQPSSETGQSELVSVIQSLQTLLHALGLPAGMKGVLGIMLRDPQRLRVLYYYHFAEILMSCIAVSVREMDLCDELVRLQKLHKPVKIGCSSARVMIFTGFCIHTLQFTYFAFCIWSLVKRLEDGEFGRPPFIAESELVDHAGLTDPWLIMARGGNDSSSFLQQRAPLNAQGRASGGSAPQPYAGEPRTLSEQAPPEPFSGTPHRLE